MHYERAICARMVDSNMDESGRSPLHHACWRGSLANVELLLDLGCDLDAWSTGLHSYGKTPIFYAITRCRNEVVELLLARGAKTRILNNKGQSVLSLASSHLRPAVIEAVAEAEANEGEELPEAWRARLAGLPQSARPALRTGGWLDFWASHPDGQTYGDLDPRFYVARSRPLSPSDLPLSLPPHEEAAAPGARGRRHHAARDQPDDARGAAHPQAPARRARRRALSRVVAAETLRSPPNGAEPGRTWRDED